MQRRYAGRIAVIPIIEHMTTTRIALANLPVPGSPAESVDLAARAVAEAGAAGAVIICFPECYLPGYRGPDTDIPPPDPSFLESAWKRLGAAAREASICVVLGTERVVAGSLLATALVIQSDGQLDGFQDKVQIDPSEEGTYTPGTGRRLFHAGDLTFGIAICHEGWRYPETFRWAAIRGAQIVFHPHFHQAQPGGYVPATFAHPSNTFHEKAILCRAAENTCYVATVNCASEGSPTTSAVVNPDGTLHAYQPYGKAGLLTADLDLSLATGLLAARYRQL